MKFIWPHPLQCEIAFWPTLKNGNSRFPAGIAHFLEHLFFRQLKLANDLFGNNEAVIANGRTQTDHFYVYTAHHHSSSPSSILQKSLNEPKCFISREIFIQEQQVVCREIEETKGFAELLVSQIQERYFQIPKKNQGILGSAKNIASLQFEECQQMLKILIEEHHFLNASQEKGRDFFTQTPTSTSEFQLEVDVTTMPLGKKFVILCVLKVSNPSAEDIFRLQILDQILRHLPGKHNLNTLVREQFGNSYGFHGLQLSQGNESTFVLAAQTNAPPSLSMIALLNDQFNHLQDLMRDLGETAIKRMLLEEEFYGCALSTIHKLPALALRFGDLAPNYFRFRKELLKNSLPHRLVTKPIFEAEGAHAISY